MINLKFTMSSSYILSKDLNKSPIILSLEERIRNVKKFSWFEKIGTENKYNKITQEAYIIFPNGSKITFGKGF